MPDEKPCIRCTSQIDAHARLCPYCNWDQSEPPPPETAPPVELYVPRDRQRRNTILGAAGFAALGIIAFVVGSLAHELAASEAKAAQPRNTAAAAATQTANPIPPNNVTLVPLKGTDETAPFAEEPITSVPATTTAQPNDVTALSWQQYAAAAARAKAEQQQEQQQANQIADPRALTGTPYEMPRTPARTAEQTPKEAASQPPPLRTPAVPEYKPLPSLDLDREMTARLTVSVAPDGHVTAIEVEEPVPQMDEVIAAVQNWRFKPATLNGTPVPARVAVDIIFHGNG